MDILNGLDYGTLYHFQHEPNRIWFFDQLLPFVAPLGSYPVLALFVLLGTIFLRVRHRYQDIIYLIGCTAAGVILAEAAKLIIQHRRPPDWTGSAWEGFSFPSAAALVSAIVYFALAHVFTAHLRRTFRRKILMVITLGFVVLIGFSLIYLRHNWVSDVLGGWLGSALVLLVGSRYLQGKHRPGREELQSRARKGM